MSVELTLLVAVVGGLIGIGLGWYITRDNFRMPDMDFISWIENQEAREGIYHGIEGCNDPDCGHPINSERNL